MSRENLETVRQLNAAFNNRSEGWADFYAPEAEIRTPAAWLEDSVYIGPGGIGRIAAAISESFDELRWDTERMIDAGDCVVALYRSRGRIKGSDAPIEAPVGAVFYVRDGKVMRALFYFSWADALEAVGLAD
jgi:uncharacterized protein